MYKHYISDSIYIQTQYALKINVLWTKNKRIWSKIGLKINAIRTKNKTYSV